MGAKSFAFIGIIVVCLGIFCHVDVQGFTNGNDAAIISTLKEAWRTTVPQNWQKSSDPCGAGFVGVNCSTSGRIVNLSLSAVGLSGNLPSDIGSLGELQTLDLSYNTRLTGSLPSSLGNLINLKFMVLIGCSFTGSIPQELGSLVKLTFLALNQNNLTGTIPPSLGDLVNLYWFDISNNSITGSLPISGGKQSGLDRLLQAKHFHFSQNKLTGAIPAALFSSQMKLIHILFDSNEFSGEFPTTVTNVTTLQVLRLDRNGLSGQIPSDLNNLRNVTELNLSNNKFNGTIPALTNITSLQYMDLSNNSFVESEFPRWLTDMGNLNTIMMENCNLTGQIPNATFEIPSLETLKLGRNKITGSLDVISVKGTNLELVDLENNEITRVDDSASFTLLLQGNPVCEDSSSSSQSYCQSSNPQQNTYTTSLSSCQGKSCKKNLDINPVTCYCQNAYSGVIIFKAPSFSRVSNKNRFHELEVSLLRALPFVLVFLQSNNFDYNSYLIVNVKFFPADGSPSLTTSNLTILNYLLGQQVYTPPTIFGPYIFFPQSNSEESGGGGSSLSPGAIAGIVIVVVILLVSAVCAVLFALKQKRRADSAIKANKPFAIWTRKGSAGFPVIKGCRLFTFDEVKIMTNGFSKNNEIGAGGYGMVYKGILDGGEIVAVKRAKQVSLQGANEFRNEVELLSRVHHKNLVGLVGFCFEEGEQMLVYEYIPNGTIGEALHGKRKLRLDWYKRVEIALDSARGLAYLHELADPPIIHRDIKAANILLDKNLTAKVADFGLSKLFDEENEKGYMTTQVKGTLGYLDPEYYMSQKLTERSDVYSLGIVMLELVTARLPIQDNKHIVRVVKEALNSGGINVFQEVLDPVLKKQSVDSNNSEGLERFLNLALNCTEDEDSQRPFMRTVVKELEAIMESMDGISQQPSRNQSYVRTHKSAASFYSNLDVEMGDSSGSAFRSREGSSMFSSSGDSFTNRPVEPK